MLLEIWRTAPSSLLIAIVGSLVIAGWLKGVIGVGMPIVALPLLSMLIDVRASVMLLSVPLVLSNIPQALEGGKVIPCMAALVPVLLGMLPGIIVGVAILLTIDPTMAKLIAGVVVIIIGGLTLLAPKLEIKGRAQTPIGLASGFLGGILGGVAAMPGPIVFVYLLAKGLRGRNFTKEASMFLVLSAALLAAILTSSHVFGWSDLGVSTAALAPVAVGMVMGQKVRDTIPAQAFKKAVLVVVLLSGAELVRKAIFA
jgi:uncharacterized protein